MKETKPHQNNKEKEGKGIPRKKNAMPYSLLTIVLMICILELGFGVFQNINKKINFNSKIKHLELKRDEELNKNKQLKSDIENFDSASTLESIARNNLKMASEDEILVIINDKNQNKEEEVKVNNKNYFHRKNKTAQ